jgi:hypothetical protein
MVETALDLNITPGLGDEFAFLCACVTGRLDCYGASSAERRRQERLEWESFLRLAEHHGVLALVAHNLKQSEVALPQEIAQSLDSAYSENLRRNLWFAAELERICEQLSKCEIHVIPYKGPVLAQSSYGDLGLRSFSDLDLLISPSEVEGAKRALAEIGYFPSQALSPAFERLSLRFGYERAFDGTAAKNLIELQWSLLPHFYAVDFAAANFRVEDLFAPAGRIRLGALTVPCLSAEDSLLALSLHAAKHLFSRLIWIADIAETLRSSRIDFDVVVCRARAMGIERIIGVSLRLAHCLLGARLPAPALELISRDAQILRLGDEFTGRLARSAAYDLESREYFLKVRDLREHARDRWRYLWRLIWTPGPGDFAAVKLPEALFPLYGGVRIARLLSKLT